jgi:tRNA(fMet)-specific endonuclease VapC
MLDTNTVSYILKGISAAARKRLSALRRNEVACVSAITEGELWYGLERIGSGDLRRAALRAFLARVEVLPWDSDAALSYGAFRAHQEAIGRPLGPLDTQIAAHAIAIGAILITNDTAFNHAAGLCGLERWATDV